MRAASERAVRAGVLAALVASGCGGTAGAREPAPAAPAAEAGGGMTAAEFEAAYRARQEQSRQRYTAADVAFMSGMIGHHAQALVMAGLAETNGASESIRTLAARITNAQRDEIATMQRWLRARGQPVPEVHIDGLKLMVHGSAHAHHMPGMLSEAQLQELASARGRRFDRLFLEYMVQHHRGAVTMVHELFTKDGAGQDEEVFKFASDAQVDQGTEIARMEKMLAALPADGGRQ